jgi:hypothetical protein
MASIQVISMQQCVAWNVYTRSLQLSSVSVVISPCIHCSAKLALYCCLLLQADCNIFGEYIQKNLALYELNNELRLTSAAAANFVRRELATALRSGPYQVGKIKQSVMIHHLSLCVCCFTDALIVSCCS